MKQELEMVASQRSPLHSPSTEQPPVRLPPCSQSPEHPPLHLANQRITQGENLTVSVNAESKDGETHTGSQTELQRLDSSGKDDLREPSRSVNLQISQESGATPHIMHTSIDSHMVTSSLVSTNQLVESSLDTSAQSQRRGQLHSQNLPQTLSEAASNHITLAGATVLESDSDERPEPHPQGRQQGCGSGCDAQSRLARSSQELERIQQTLRELQAFLQEGVSLEATDSPTPELEQPQKLRDNMDTEPENYKGVSSDATPPGLEVGQRFRERHEGRGLMEQTGWHRAMELEARIRQAGLTPPSFMKRSASLAKLDCLELSANDLNDLDLRTHTRTISHSQDSSSLSQSHPDDTWKKQKVLSQNTGLSNDDTSSPPPPCLSYAKDKAERDEPDGSVVASTSRQQGRGHSSRRPRKASAEKKRAAALLYNTM